MGCWRPVGLERFQSKLSHEALLAVYPDGTDAISPAASCPTHSDLGLFGHSIALPHLTFDLPLLSTYRMQTHLILNVTAIVGVGRQERSSGLSQLWDRYRRLSRRGWTGREDWENVVASGEASGRRLMTVNQTEAQGTVRQPG